MHNYCQNSDRGLRGLHIKLGRLSSLLIRQHKETSNVFQRLVHMGQWRGCVAIDYYCNWIDSMDQNYVSFSNMQYRNFLFRCFLIFLRIIFDRFLWKTRIYFLSCYIYFILCRYPQLFIGVLHDVSVFVFPAFSFRTTTSNSIITCASVSEIGVKFGRVTASWRSVQ